MINMTIFDDLPRCIDDQNGDLPIENADFPH